MKRESSPEIEATLKHSETVLQSKGCTPPQVRAIKASQLLILYWDTIARETKKHPNDAELFLHFKKAVSLTLDEIGEQALAEQVQTFQTLEQLAPVLKEVFDVRQPVAMMNNVRLLYKKHAA